MLEYGHGYRQVFYEVEQGLRGALCGREAIQRKPLKS